MNKDLISNHTKCSYWDLNGNVCKCCHIERVNDITCHYIRMDFRKKISISNLSVICQKCHNGIETCYKLKRIDKYAIANYQTYGLIKDIYNPLIFIHSTIKPVDIIPPIITSPNEKTKYVYSFNEVLPLNTTHPIETSKKRKNESQICLDFDGEFHSNAKVETINPFPSWVKKVKQYYLHREDNAIIVRKNIISEKPDESEIINLNIIKNTLDRDELYFTNWADIFIGDFEKVTENVVIYVSDNKKKPSEEFGRKIILAQIIFEYDKLCNIHIKTNINKYYNDLYVKYNFYNRTTISEYCKLWKKALEFPKLKYVTITNLNNLSLFSFTEELIKLIHASDDVAFWKNPLF